MTAQPERVDDGTEAAKSETQCAAVIVWGRASRRPEMRGLGDPFSQPVVAVRLRNEPSASAE